MTATSLAVGLRPAAPPQFPPQTPPEAPMSMPAQRLDIGPEVLCNAPAPKVDAAAQTMRMLVFGGAAGLTAWFTWTLTDIFSRSGLTWGEATIVGLFALNFFWIALAFANAAVGACIAIFGPRSVRTDAAEPVVCAAASANSAPLSIAILVPTCNESPQQVFGGICAMLTDLKAAAPAHRFHLFVLSDTTDAAIGALERTAFDAARRRSGAWDALFYRCRSNNTGKKAGNVAEWVRRWGGAYDAMLVLDADSVITAEAMIRLADALAAAPSTGLVQSAPRLIYAHSLFARLQQFASSAYGACFARGLASWFDGEGNFWGHNAIIRTRAFAQAAGLPILPGRAPFGGPIMSHDFVEAALLRRAGWRVRMLPLESGSYEESPPTLIDHAIRDRRWCQGNLQHMRLIGARGLHPLNRLHLLQGAMAYLASPLWLLFIAAGIGAATHAAHAPISYFDNPHSLFPTWPMIDAERARAFMGATFAVLLAPKLFGLVSVMVASGAQGRENWGGWSGAALSAIIETLLSAMIAPVMMIQQSKAVFNVLRGADGGWKPQNRNARYTMRQTLRFHAVETVIGAGLCAGLCMGLLSVWITPIAISLILAAPISHLCGLNLSRTADRAGILVTPESLAPPPVVQMKPAETAAIAEKVGQPLPDACKPVRAIPPVPATPCAASAAP